MPSEGADKAAISSASDERTINNTVRHQYKVLNDTEKLQMLTVKDQGLMLLNFIDKLGSKREYSIAKTKIEEAVMWAVKGITG
jgi:hypothetical protein